MNARPILFALLAAAASLTPAFAADEPLPVPANVDEARARLRFLGEQAGRLEGWVEENWEAAFARQFPDLSRAPQGPAETLQAFRERQMRNRVAVGEVISRLKTERREWLENERRAVLALEITEAFPVRLGAYDAERGEYPLLLGFGWPAGIAATLKVPEKRKDVFAIRFPRAVPAVFRVNATGEAYLLSIDKEKLGAEVSVVVAQTGPRLLWRGAHESWVTSVSLRPDGVRAVSGGGDGALCAWDAETGNPIWRIPNVEMALSLAHGPDGAVFATGGTDSLARLREAETGKELWRAQAAGMVFSVAFSPDGRFVASGDDGGSLRLWNTESGKEVLRAEVGAPVLSVAYSPDGKWLVAGSEGGFVVRWEVGTGRQAWRAPFDGQAYAVAANPAGTLVAAGGTAADLTVLRASDGSEAWRRKADGEVRAVRFDPSGRLLAFGGSGYRARILGAETGEPMWSASIGSPVRALDFGPRGSKLLVGSADFSVRLFEVDEGDRVRAAFSGYGPLYVERADALRLFR